MKDSIANTMSFLDHLEELRWVIVKSLLAFVVAVAAVWHVSDALFVLFRRPLQSLESSVELIMISPLEGFFLQFRLSVVAGAFLAAPFIVGFVWSFVAPGLTRRERRVLWAGVLSGLVFFCIGAALGYLLLSVAVPFLHSFRMEGVANRWSANRYLGFCMHLMLATAVVFQVPVVLLALIRLKLVGTAALRKGRPYAIVLAFVLAAVLTPPDVLTQILVALPLLLMYETTILFATWQDRQQRVQ